MKPYDSIPTLMQFKYFPLPFQEKLHQVNMAKLALAEGLGSLAESVPSCDFFALFSNYTCFLACSLASCCCCCCCLAAWLFAVFAVFAILAS